MRSAIVFTVLVLSSGRYPASGLYQPPQRPALDTLVGAIGQIVVPVQEPGRDQRVEGSGVIVGPEGLVVTSYHVVQGSDSHAGTSPEVFFNPTDPSRPDFSLDAKGRFRLQFVRADLQADLALFRIVKYTDGRSIPPEQKFPWLRLGSFDAVKILDPVFVMGFPQVGGETLTVVEGKVAGKDAVHEWIKVDASLSRGYSGGAVINSGGELLGIATEIRADVEEVDSEKKGDPAIRVLYGMMNWVRPSSILARLLKPPGQPPHVAAASISTGLIGGRVTSNHGKPVTGALVGLLKEGSQMATTDNLISYSRTDNAGQFQIRTIPGRYTLRVVARGYQPGLESVELKHADRTLHITLKATP